MNRITVFGGHGGLGKAVCQKLRDKYEVLNPASSVVDVTDYDAVESFFSDNATDIVLNFSGYNFDCFVHKYADSNQSEIDKMIDVNIKGSVNIVRACLPQMRARGFGRIILASSILAESPVVSTGIYSGCKGFLDSLAKTVALENAAKGITCNTLQMGYFDAGLTHRIPEETRDNILKSIPLNRFGRIDELVNIIEMLIQVGYVTGTSLKVNGGKDF